MISWKNFARGATSGTRNPQVDAALQQQVNQKKFGQGGLVKKVMGTGFVLGAGVETAMNMKGGDDFGTAAVKGAFSGMLWTTMPGIMTAHLAATTLPSVFAGVHHWKREKEQWWNKQHLPNFGGNYQDTARAQTMRQAAVQAIQGSKMNARSALGGEAKLISQNFNRG